MVSVGLLVELEARAGKEDEVSRFLEEGLALARGEPTTVAWFAVRLDQSRFAIFDVFDGEAGRQAHLTGPLAEALLGRANELFVRAPQITPATVVAATV